jgi:hypothetical protein
MAFKLLDMPSCDGADLMAPNFFRWFVPESTSMTEFNKNGMRKTPPDHAPPRSPIHNI